MGNPGSATTRIYSSPAFTVKSVTTWTHWTGPRSMWRQISSFRLLIHWILWAELVGMVELWDRNEIHSVNTPWIRVYSHQAKVRAQVKKIKEQAKKIKRIHRKHQIKFRFFSVWTQLNSFVNLNQRFNPLNLSCPGLICNRRKKSFKWIT